jgi:hypothetical protein
VVLTSPIGGERASDRRSSFQASGHVELQEIHRSTRHLNPSSLDKEDGAVCDV